MKTLVLDSSTEREDFWKQISLNYSSDLLYKTKYSSEIENLSSYNLILLHKTDYNEMKETERLIIKKKPLVLFGGSSSDVCIEENKEKFLEFVPFSKISENIYNFLDYIRHKKEILFNDYYILIGYNIELEARLEFLHNLLTPEGIADYLVTSEGNEDRLSNVQKLNVNNEILLNLLKELKIVADKGCFSKEYVEALREIRDFVLN